MLTLQAKTKAEELKEYLGLMQQLTRLDPAQEEICLSQMLSGDEQARCRLVESYLPQVIAWTAPLRGRGISFLNLIEAGNQALIGGLAKVEKTSDLGEVLRVRVLLSAEQSLQQVRSD